MKLFKNFLFAFGCALILLVVVNVKCSAQIKANFASSVSSGCAPLVVQFFDSSTGGATSWYWDFGIGTSVKQNPGAIYFYPGIYNVKLVVKNANGSDSVVRNNYITIYSKPDVKFTQTNLNNCSPVQVQFTDKSNPKAGAITAWKWDFGDGNSSNEQNPMHSYVTGGNFGVTLNVTNTYGCTQFLTTPALITVPNPVKAGFSYSYASVCSAPAAVSFNNTSNSNSPLTYQWLFGDGQASTQGNPQHNYSLNGQYNIRLIARTDAGCADTLVQPISIGSVKPRFTLPLDGCANEPIVFSDSSVPTPKLSTWYFGDNSIDTGAVVVHSYLKSGSYAIKLIADFGDCKDSITKIFAVTAKPKAAFTSSGNTGSCAYPSTVNFTNASTGAVSYFWDFGDSTSTSTVENPVHTYTKAGFFTVTLVAINSNGCSDTVAVQKFIKLGPPRIDSLQNLPYSGCLPATVSFGAFISSGDPVNSYKWDFGDGQTSNLQSPKHLYTNVGAYTVKLTVSTTSGCSDSITVANAIRVGNKPKAQFSASPLNACATSTAVYFTDMSTGDITAWLWDLGDGGSSTYKDAGTHYYKVGDINVKLTVYSNGCADSTTRFNYVHVNPPIADFTVVSDCKYRFSKYFYDYSPGATAWMWDFGDGQTSTLKNPSHIYAKGGTYVVKHTAINDTCSSVKTETIVIRDKQIDFTYTLQKPNLCKYDSIVFNTSNWDTAYVTGLKWDFGDSTTTGFGMFPSATHFYNKAGTYTPVLITKNFDGCSDTIIKVAAPLTVYGPTAGFANPAGACVKSTVDFTDQSKDDGTHALTKWVWQYGDGTVVTNNAPPFTHSYINTGSYNVQLTVFDSYGCRDSLLKNGAFTIEHPTANFSTVDQTRCSLSLASFVDSSVGTSLTWLWNFGDGKSSTEQNPQHAYSTAGSYNVYLKVTDGFNCVDSIVKKNFIKIADASASFNLSDTFTTCPPLIIRPANNSKNAESVTWDFGDGNTSELNNPLHYYTSAGTFQLKLVAHGHGECLDSMAKTIVILGPSGNLKYSTENSCAPATANFNVENAKKISGYIWDFGDGTTQTNFKPNPTYVYNNPGIYYPKVILLDSFGCKVPLFDSSKSIAVSKVTAKFSFINQGGCDSNLVAFSDSSMAYFDTVKSVSWSFGDNTTSNLSNPSHHYSKSGTYNVTLVVNSLNGCSSTFTASINVQVSQSPVVTATIPPVICNNSAGFKASAQAPAGDNIHWVWRFGTGDSSNQQNPDYTYASSGNYTVSVTAINQNGCSNSVQQNISVAPIPPVRAGHDTTVCDGQSVNLKASGADMYQWANSQTLSCLNCVNPVALPDTDTHYYVTGTNAGGCSATDSILIKVQKRLKLSVEKTDSVCLGKSVQLKASGEDVYSWQPSTALSNPNVPNPLASPAAATVYTLVARDKTGCFTDTADVSVRVMPNPYLNIVDSFATVNAGVGYQVNTVSSPDVVKWLWVPFNGLSCYTCAQPTTTIAQTTKYIATVTNLYGCSASDNITIQPLCNNDNLFVPNTFSPNGDGMNDYFFPRGPGLANIKSMRVFSRLGQAVFEKLNFPANNQAYGWDGKYNGVLQPSDVYTYMIEVICENSKTLTISGTITLLR